MDRGLIAASKVGLREKIALGFGFFTAFFCVQGVPILAIPYYQMTLGVDPFLLSLAMTLPILLGSFAGPMVGHISDQMCGRRLPFLLFSALALGLCYGLIWMVRPDWQQGEQLIYFVLIGCLFYLAAAFYTVPLNALSYEMSRSAGERARVIGFATYFTKCGSLLYQWIFPLSQLAFFGSVYLGIQYIGWGMGIIVFFLLGAVPALLLRERFLPIGHLLNKAPFWLSLRLVAGNSAMKILILLVFLQVGGNAFVASMDYYLLVYFMHAGDIAEGAAWKGVLSTAYAVVSMISVPLVLKFSSSFGKLKTLKNIYIINALGGCLKWFIFVPGAEWIIVFDAILCGAIWTAVVVLIPAMVSDLSYAHQQEAQNSQAGMFASVHHWVQSLSGVIALLLSGLSLNLIGFDAKNGAAQSPESLQSMRFILSAGTVFFSLLPLIVLWLLKKFKSETILGLT